MREWIDKSFGNYAAFREAFSDKARNLFASGWTWLVLQDGKLQVLNTANADTPIVQGIKPLLVLDVWEHAYYLDYKNRRDRYIDVFFDHLINWDFAANNLGEI
jgi:Fe-Mn family superoxide dismutase